MAKKIAKEFAPCNKHPNKFKPSVNPQKLKLPRLLAYIH